MCDKYTTYYHILPHSPTGKAKKVFHIVADKNQHSIFVIK
ncbi:MAG: hypothetical protein ACI81W_000783 [Saprospiraceae bacterium]